MNLTSTITWILVLARLIIAVQLTRVGRRQRLSNLFWLAAFFYITAVGDIILTVSPFTGVLKPFFWSAGLGEVALVMFIHKTFYQDRRSPVLLFMALSLAVLAADIVYAQFLPYQNPFNWLWLIWTGYRAYKRIAANQAVEDWVKARYKLVVAYSVAMLAAPIWSVLSVIAIWVPAVATPLYAPTALVVAQVGILAIATFGIALQYLAWVMPERYRLWLNRNYRSPVPETEAALTEEDLMRKVKA